MEVTGREDFSVLEGVDTVLSGAMPEGVVFRTTYSRRHIIHVWCMMEEDAISEELMREFSEITIEGILTKFGCSEEQTSYVLNVLSRL